MKYYIISGEASGDLHGSNLMKGIYAEDPQADIRFWGGDCMESVWKENEAGKVGAEGAVQDRATPLAAGGGTHEVGGVVPGTTVSGSRPKVGNDPVFDDQICILYALHPVHRLTFQLQNSLRQYSCQSSDIVYYCLHIVGER